MSWSARTGLLFSRIVLHKYSAPRFQADVRTIQRWVFPTLRVLKNRRDKIGPESPQPRSSYLEWNYDKEVFAFGQRLNEKFDKKVLARALTHRSYAINAQADDAEIMESNQDLIEEGSKIINDYLRKEFQKDYPEDVVKALVEYLTTEDMLAHIGKHMGLTDIILTSEFPVEKATIADTFKAVVAAVDQSQSLERAELFVKDFLECQLIDKEIFDIYKPDKPLEYLSELLKTKGITEIEPRLCHKSAVNTILANFQVGLYSKSDRKLLGIGWGESIENAKETAALDAIHRIHKEQHKIYKQY